jgi:bifunctional UDP-N-acetylglucosamine pyrophosphorylase/glucosamine-1-phosphate N-acetyltransferase
MTDSTSRNFNSTLGIIVLAAGQGTRMKSSTPKVLHPILGKSLLQRVLETAQALDPQQTVTVLRHEAQQILEGLPEFLNDTNTAMQSDVPGTGSGALAGLLQLNNNIDTVLVLSGDTPLITPETLNNLLQAHRNLEASITVLTAINETPFGYGRIIRTPSTFAISQDGVFPDDSSAGSSDVQRAASIKAIVEEKDASESERQIQEVNSGIYVFDAHLLREVLPTVGTGNAQGEMYLTDVVLKASEQGKLVCAHQIDDIVQTEGVNNRAQLASLTAVLRDRINEDLAMAGVTIVDPSSTWIEDTVVIENDVVIEPNCLITGHTIIHSGASILLGSRLIDAEIEGGANVGPYAFLRPGAHLLEDSKAGAFVEIKNSTVGKGSKVPHLSYVGDATIGENSNIGAGSIFANYDGVNKHKTFVGNNVKIGSKTVLVAPVEVGDNVYTGAASLVRSDIPDGALSITKSEQIIKEGWTANRLSTRPPSS